MAKARIEISFTIGPGFALGDYAYLYGNGGSGAIDYETPVIDRPIDLFPARAGIYGFGRAPFGRNRFGRATSIRTPGFGRCPFGRSPFGRGAVTIRIPVDVATCGTYLFGLIVYDPAGNASAATPPTATAVVHLAPDEPTGLKLSSYDPETDTLTLAAAG